MIYLDNAATGGRKPDGVLSAVRSAIILNANPGRSGHKLSLAKAKQVLACRNALSQFFDGYGFEQVAFTKNCTEALNIALFSALGENDHVVVSCMEHNSVLRPLEELKRTKNVHVDVCPLTDGNISPKALLSLVNEKTKALVVTSASNVTGAMPPLEKIGALLPKNVLFIVDGAQGGGHLPISMKKSKIDYLALAGHKGLFALQGSGALLFSKRAAPKPLLYGGTGTTSFDLAMPDFYPDRLEAGTLSYPAILSLLEGVRYLSYHFSSIATEIKKRTEFFCEGLEKLKGYKAYSFPNPCGIISFSHERLPSEWIATELDEKYSICVRGGLHCAPKMHEALGTIENGLVRVSYSHFNTDGETKELLKALAKIEKAY